MSGHQQRMGGFQGGLAWVYSFVFPLRSTSLMHSAWNWRTVVFSQVREVVKRADDWLALVPITAATLGGLHEKR